MTDPPAEVTRYYIGITPDGEHVSFKYGPGPHARGPHAPIDVFPDCRVFPVDEAVWRVWNDDDCGCCALIGAHGATDTDTDGVTG